MDHSTTRTNMHVRFFCIIVILTGGLSACSTTRSRATEAKRITGGGDALAGAQRIRYYGCNTCHTIPGIPGADGLVGPPLTNIASRLVIAGQLTNTAKNMMSWIQHPRRIQPQTVMPEMGVSEGDSRDIAAYLYTLR
jgi:cytochrome c